MTKKIATHWRLIPQRYNLVGSRCVTCGTVFFPPRPLCPHCRRRGRMEDYTLVGRGEIFSHTTVHAPPEGYDLLRPYVLAVIKLDEGPLVTAQVVDCAPDEVEVGQRVELVFRKIIADGADGIIRYGYKFRRLRGNGKR